MTNMIKNGTNNQISIFSSRNCEKRKGQQDLPKVRLRKTQHYSMHVWKFYGM